MDKPKFIHNLFSRIAGKYNLLNDVMTLSLHRQWKKQAVAIAAKAIKRKDAKVLDLCTGTGDIAELWIANPAVKDVIAVDSCAQMLQVGYQQLEQKFKGPPPKLQMIEADALSLPFEDNSFDAVTVGFGLRNVNDLLKACEEIKRVLRPGGILVSLDLGHPSIPLVDWLYKNILLKIIPIIGMLFAQDKAAYQYLSDSLKTWPLQKELSQGLYSLGFTRSFTKDIMLGTIAIVAAEK
ncbi:MAG: ubiquinone/menaquinone biosynthesis methyltransferase [Cyanobacteria bacterium]|nr:ubiquinone/menaquinone biosynthesis methyltransferase [Cyanobacteriota bacterium]MDA1020338.1 ubiquinone/menaquinone biosynthesis methyltransferase [Cyanobacteriota bacterium]